MSPSQGHDDGAADATVEREGMQVEDAEDAEKDGGPPGHTRRRGVVVAVTAVATVAALVVTGAVVLFNRHRGPSHPSEWDPEVAALVSFVEKEKGASFEHPVRVVSLDEAEFKGRLEVDDELSVEERDEVERTEAVLRALGLQGGSGSVLDQVNTLTTEGTAAFYDPDREEIVMPASSSRGLSSQANLVHELTHALQDQLGQLARPEDSEARVGHDALIEGEAEHVEAAWTEALSDRERERLEAAEADTSDAASGDLEAVSPALVAVFVLPYVVGEAMVEVLDGAGELDGAFDDPPNSSADILDPSRWLEPVETIELDAPPLADGEVQHGEDDTLGAHVLYLMLASALEPADALDVVSGWGGDRMRFFDAEDGTRCLRVSVVGVSPAATVQLGHALEAWVAGRPDGAASTREVGHHIELDACDRGTAAVTLTTDLATVPSVRAQLATALTHAGTDIDTATCVATEVIDLLPLELVTSEELSEPQQQRLRDAVTDAAATCTGTG